ncbi:hypothetical protein ACHAXR_013460 [Thalassiosira sp. AJA248-18]
MATVRKKVQSASASLPRPQHEGNDKRFRGQLKWKLPRVIRDNFHGQLKLKLFPVIGAAQFVLETMTCTPFSIAAIALVLASFCIGDDELQSTLMKIGMGYLWVVKPLLSTLTIICDIDLGGKEGNSNSTKKGGAMARIIALSFLMSIICNQFPKWLSAFVACGGLFAFGLASRQLVPQQSKSTAFHSPASSNHDSNILQKTWSRLSLKERTAVGGIVLVATLLIENFIIWVVSATYQPGIDGSPDPLQDNGRIVMEKLAMKVFNVDAAWKAKKALQKLRDGLSVEWALVSSLGASFVCLELRLGKSSQRTLSGLALHALLTLAAARMIRTISFVLTVLPSQVVNCYAHHFPPPPAEWKEWLMVGFLPNSRGGCNDLILSGHATVTSTIACAITSAASNTSFSIAVWTLIALDYSIESYQGLHYSVDMWLGCIVTCLLWQLTKPLEIGRALDQPQHDNVKREDTNRPSPLNATIVAMYALPPTLAFVILMVVPEAYVNYFLVGYSVWAGVILLRSGFTHFLQHLLLCELCFGLGAYL